MAERLYTTINKNNNIYYKCNVCDEYFNIEELEPHLINEHSNECYNCMYCKELFITISQKRKHKCNKVILNAPIKNKKV